MNPSPAKTKIAAVAVLGITALVVVILIKTRPEPQRAAIDPPVFPVRFEALQPQTVGLEIHAGGVVKPSQTVMVMPQVAGKVVWVSENLEPGGRFGKGDLLFQIETSDYEHALTQQRANLQRAAFELKEEQGRQAIASREWEMLGKSMTTTPEGKALALREPQLARAQSNLEAAQSAVAQAELNLARCDVVAPFDSMVQSYQVALGQSVSLQTRAVTMIGIESYWVQASIPVDSLGYFDLPDAAGKGGASASIFHADGPEKAVRRARLVRLLPDLEEAGRMARVLLEVEDPLGQAAGDLAPMLLGSYVRTVIHGHTLENVFALPAPHVHEGNHIWLIDSQNRLEIRQVEPIWHQAETVLVNRDLQAGERLVTDRLATPIPGTRLMPVHPDPLDAGGPGEDHTTDGTGAQNE